MPFPLTAPSTGIRSITMRPNGSAGIATSPTSFLQNVQDFGGHRWEADIELVLMNRADAAAWAALLLALHGTVGTFLLGDPFGATPRGTFGGTPLVVGAHAVGATSIALDGLSAAATGKALDYLQTGSGSTTHLYALTEDATANGSGEMTVSIWPPLRAALADNDAIVKSSTKGHWRLASNMRGWQASPPSLYDVQRIVTVEAF